MACVMIEDQVAPKRCGHVAGKTVVSREEAVARIRAACDARDEMGAAGPLIMARVRWHCEWLSCAGCVFISHQLGNLECVRLMQGASAWMKRLRAALSSKLLAATSLSSKLLKASRRWNGQRCARLSADCCSSLLLSCFLYPQEQTNSVLSACVDDDSDSCSIEIFLYAVLSV